MGFNDQFANQYFINLTFQTLKFIYIQFTICKSVILSIFTRPCTHYHYLIPEHFHYPRRKPLVLQQSLPYFTFLCPLATTNLLSVSVDFPVVDILRKWNCLTSGLLCLTSFAQHVFLGSPVL